MKKFGTIIKRKDGSFVINNGLYHVPNAGKYAALWEDVYAYAAEHPDMVTEEQLPAEPTLEDLKSAKLAEINGSYTAAASALVSTYPATELLTFDKQEAEARAYSADPASETPLVDALAAGRAMDKSELVRRIIAKADAFAVAVGYYTGQRQHYEDQLSEAVTAADIAAIVPVYALPDEIQSEETTTEQPADTEAKA